jgi:hypothetical protein
MPLEPTFFAAAKARIQALSRSAAAHPLAFVATVAAGVIVPSVVITAFAFQSRDPHQIGRFAGTIAEPLALLGGAWVVYRWPMLIGRRSSVLLGVSGALGMIAAAFWVHDVDGWTAAAGILLPLARMIRHRRSEVDEPPQVGGAAGMPALGAPAHPPAYQPANDARAREL